MPKVSYGAELFADLKTPESTEMTMRATAVHLVKAGQSLDDPAHIRQCHEIHHERAANAIVRQGRWVAFCPDCDPMNTMIEGPAVNVTPGHPMMCPFCCNKELGGRWRKVVFPDAREEIDAVLGMRLKAITQNWELGESVADLRQQNLDHPDELQIQIIQAKH